MHEDAGINDLVARSGLIKRIRNLPPVLRALTLVALPVLVLAMALGIVYYFVSPLMAGGLLASILAGAATGAGALPIWIYRNVSERSLHIMLSWAAGVMLAATAFALIEPGIEYGNALWADHGTYIVAFGMILGAGFLELTDRFFPHSHLPAHHNHYDNPAALRKLWLFIAAITLHNFPEGLAVGVSFGSGNWQNGTSLAFAIGMQNMPEGLAVALPLVAMGYSRGYALAIATLTGLVEPIGGMLGIISVSAFTSFLPIGMGFAAGAMLFVIVEDIIPETHSRGKLRPATFALLLGFIVMMMLENLLG
jgi:ZIP family zinc transporter